MRATTSCIGASRRKEESLIPIPLINGLSRGCQDANNRGSSGERSKILSVLLAIALAVSSAEAKPSPQSRAGSAIRNGLLRGNGFRNSATSSCPAFAFPPAQQPDSTWFLSRILAPTISSMGTYLALVAAFDRPQGSLTVDPGALVTKQSQVEGAGLGLYAARSMPEGTILGTYPGVERAANAYLGKYGRYPDCGSYAWRFTDNESYIDPTDAAGNIGDLCYGGSELVPGSLFLHQSIFRWSVDTLLARINEPPIGGPGCNVFSREDLDRRQVTFSLSRDVVEGEELFMDYGLTYDRTAYGGTGTRPGGSVYEPMGSGGGAAGE